MKGDFSRVTFDPAKNYTRVLQQQGRVQLDADWNEQADLFLHQLRTLAVDLIGPFGAPPESDGTPGLGFRIETRRKEDGSPDGLFLLPGRYYVGGIAVENPAEIRLADPLDGTRRNLLYLDVFERHVTHLQDDLLREVALHGADTTTRTQAVFKVRSTDRAPGGGDIPAELTCRSLRRDWSRWVAGWQSPQRGRLAARARPGKPDSTEPCLTSPEARYRADDNKLYRVEIRQGGSGARGTAGATFDWSADNGAVTFPVRRLFTEVPGGKTTASLEHLGRDDRAGLQQDDWVEVADGDEERRDGSSPLLRVESVDPDRREVVLAGAAPAGLTGNLVLRRWDHRRGKPVAGGSYRLVEGEWLDLEDGVQIFFEPAGDGAGHTYRAGDYWLIPARTATADVEWPGPPESPLARPPHGVHHHYAPLALLAQGRLQDCRSTFGASALTLTTGAAEWQIVEQSSGTAPVPRPAEVVHPHAAWQLLPGARWISPAPGNLPGGHYVFELRFQLAAPAEAEVALEFVSDNTAEIYLNGIKIGAQMDPNGYEKNKPPTRVVQPGIDPLSGRPYLQAGENKLQVRVYNNGGPVGTALRGVVDVGGCCCR